MMKTIANIGAMRQAIAPRMIVMAIAVRVLLLVLMSLSDVLIPDHNPGNDVLRFDLRTSSDCFCRQGLACDPKWDLYERSDEQRLCVMSAVFGESRLWNIILIPMTKWDAARFLTLAADPKQRMPNPARDDPYIDSEQAHAFFPFFPFLVRRVALILMRSVPFAYLPRTFEAVLVLSAFLVNTISFVIALFSLIDLTIRLIIPFRAPEDSLRIAGTVAVLFCLNPANVFFGTSYSESTFSMMSFVGYALYNQGHSFLAIIPWMAASYTRSNGILLSIWLIMQGVVKVLVVNRSVYVRCSSFAWHAILAVMVALPIVIHDRSGHNIHCQGDVIPPKWCTDNIGSFYSHVQRKYWNVGFLQYFEQKQTPNFLLAAPIIFFSFQGAWIWIKISWKEFPYNDGKNGLLPSRLLRWTVWALRGSSQTTDITGGPIVDDVLHSPLMLAHYAVLAAVAVLGLTMAHVQITTRLVCSSCPAIYWHLAYVKPKWLVIAYCTVYILVGSILHVNFLPWT